MRGGRSPSDYVYKCSQKTAQRCSVFFNVRELLISGQDFKSHNVDSG